MRILFVAMANSIHTARWIGQVADQGWDLHLFSSIDSGVVQPALRNVTVHDSFYSWRNDRHASVKSRGIPFPSKRLADIARRETLKIAPEYRVDQLTRLVRKLKPDLIHSLEIQAGGYLTLKAKQQMNGSFPCWMATNWGSDIFLFGRLAAHAKHVRAVLQALDYYWCECQRDVELARANGLKGVALPVLPIAGGLDLGWALSLKQPGLTSERPTILLKGYQHFVGRALVGLRALRLCAKELAGYRLVIYMATDDVKLAAELFSQDTGIEIEIVPRCSHEEMLRLFANARIYIGLSVSDGISTSLLEAITMGTFPIQSSTACADEWIVHGESGMIVPPEDPVAIAEAIRRALKDDTLVNKAAEMNARVVAEKLDYAKIQAQVIQSYKDTAAGKRMEEL